MLHLPDRPSHRSIPCKKLNRKNAKPAISPDADHMLGIKGDGWQVSQSAVRWSKEHASEQTVKADGG